MAFLKRHWQNILVAAVFLCVLQILLWPCNYFQGWGGDYAGYLGQARQLLEGRSMSESNYIYNPKLPYLAPPSYPMGFPLLLAPFFAKFGLDLLPYVKLVTVTFWLSGFIFFLILRRNFSVWVALVASLAYLFNPYFFYAKNGILPDYLFACWLLLGAYWYTDKDRGQLKNVVICGVLAGLAWITRANGVVIILAWGLDILIEHLVLWQKQRKIQLIKEEVKFVLLASGIAFAIQFGVHGLLFHLPKGGSYFDQLNYSGSMLSAFQNNLNSNLTIIINYFLLEPEMPFGFKNTDLAVKVGGIIALAFSLFGLLVPGGRVFRFYRILLGAFMLVLVVWPMAQGLRYVAPIIPLFILFSVVGINHFKVEGKFLNGLKWLLIPVLLFGEYYRLDEKIGARNLVEENGAPQYKNNQEAFQYVHDSLPADARLAYHHPLILGLYGDRKCYKWTNATDEPMDQEFVQFDIDYLMVNNWLVEFDGRLKEYLSTHSSALQKVWENERNTIYKIGSK